MVVNSTVAIIITISSSIIMILIIAIYRIMCTKTHVHTAILSCELVCFCAIFREQLSNSDFILVAGEWEPSASDTFRDVSVEQKKDCCQRGVFWCKLRVTSRSCLFCVCVCMAWGPRTLSTGTYIGVHIVVDDYKTHRRSRMRYQILVQLAFLFNSLFPIESMKL